MSPSQQKAYHVDIDPGVSGLEAVAIDKLSPESADTTNSSDSGIGGGGNISSSSNINTNINICPNSNSSATNVFSVNSSSGGGVGAAGSIRASLNSIGEFVARKHQQLAAVNKQYSVESDDSSFLVYSIKV